MLMKCRVGECVALDATGAHHITISRNALAGVAGAELRLVAMVRDVSMPPWACQ